MQALIEQITYGPAAMCSFFFGMSLLELKPISECIEEVKIKFLPTYKVFFSLNITKIYFPVCKWSGYIIDYFFLDRHLYMANFANYQFYSNSGTESCCICQHMQFGLDMFSCVYESAWSQTKTERASKY